MVDCTEILIGTCVNVYVLTDLIGAFSGNAESQMVTGIKGYSLTDRKRITAFGLAVFFLIICIDFNIAEGRVAALCYNIDVVDVCRGVCTLDSNGTSVGFRIDPRRSSVYADGSAHGCERLHCVRDGNVRVISLTAVIRHAVFGNVSDLRTVVDHAAGSVGVIKLGSACEEGIALNVAYFSTGQGVCRKVTERIEAALCEREPYRCGIISRNCCILGEIKILRDPLAGNGSSLLLIARNTVHHQSAGSLQLVKLHHNLRDLSAVVIVKVIGNANVLIVREGYVSEVCHARGINIDRIRSIGSIGCRSNLVSRDIVLHGAFAVRTIGSELRRIVSYVRGNRRKLAKNRVGVLRGLNALGITVYINVAKMSVGSICARSQNEFGKIFFVIKTRYDFGRIRLLVRVILYERDSTRVCLFGI